MLAPLALAACTLLALPTEALHGQVVDGWTLQPLAGVQLRDLDGRTVATSSPDGRFSGRVIAHMPRLRVTPPGDSHEHIVVNLPRDQAGHLLTAPLSIALLPSRPQGPAAAGAFGLPGERDHMPIPETGPTPPPLWAYTLPPQMPATIRVLRCPGTTCCDSPGDGVETLAFEDYVRGVVNAEVGVFRSMSTLDGSNLDTAQREAGSAEVFKTLAVSSRSYALYWYLRRQASNPGYDIRDGTCEQVYDDERHAWVDASVSATAGEILALSGANSIEKFEYASSCKRLGSLPYGTSATSPACGDVIADDTGVVGCVGSWCGHDTADMGHQIHPCDPGNCRCLVRGICQWGAAERSFAGEDYATTLAHYQPELAHLQLGAGDAGIVEPSGRLVGFIRDSDIYDTEAGIAGASVGLDLGDSATTNDQGYFEFSDLTPDQTVAVTASALGFQSVTENKYLDPGYAVWWKSMALQPGTASDAGARDNALPDRTNSDSGSTGTDSAVTATDGSASAADVPGSGGDDPPVTEDGCGCAQSHRSWVLGPCLLLGLLALRRRRP